MKPVVLVGCVAKKKKIRSPAKELYISPRFKHSRRLAESTGGPWFILSAEHGLIHPDEPIDWYEKILGGKPEQRIWTQKVQRQMEEKLPKIEEIFILAGEKYFYYLEPWLVLQYKAKVFIPMKGMQGTGLQLRWLRDAKTLRP